MNEYVDKTFKKCPYMSELPICLKNLATDMAFSRFPGESKEKIINRNCNVQECKLSSWTYKSEST